MNSTVEPLEGNKVKLVVSLEESELEPAIAAAWKEIAKEVRLPGFRPGKAPRKLLESRIEPGYARSEALRNELPEQYSRAVIEHEVDVVAPPELDITEGEESGDVTFEAVVEVRPVVTVSGYEQLRVEVPSPEVGDDEIDEQVDRLRAQYGELTDVDREATEGDYVTIDLTGSRRRGHGGPRGDGLRLPARFRCGRRGVRRTALAGVSAGDEVEFATAHPDPDDEEPVDYSIEVKAVGERVLPELTDEWVAGATEFDTVAEFLMTRSRLESGLEDMVRNSVRSPTGSRTGQARGPGAIRRPREPGSSGATAVDERPAGPGGIAMEDYLRIMGKEPDAFAAELREASEESGGVDWRCVRWPGRGHRGSR